MVALGHPDGRGLGAAVGSIVLCGGPADGKVYAYEHRSLSFPISFPSVTSTASLDCSEMVDFDTIDYTGTGVHDGLGNEIFTAPGYNLYFVQFKWYGQGGVFWSLIGRVDREFSKLLHSWKLVALKHEFRAIDLADHCVFLAVGIPK